MKSNELLLKEYSQERNLEIIFLVDVSKKMLLGSSKKLKAEYVAELVSSLCYSMTQMGYSVGFVMFSDKVIKIIRPEIGFKQVNTIINLLSQSENYKGNTNLNNVVEYSFNNFNKDSLVILISDFITLGISENLLKLASEKFDFISFMVRDPREVSLPSDAGEVVLSDPYTGETILVDSKKYRKEYSKETSAEISKLNSLMKKIGSDFLFLETSKDFITPLIQFFKIRESRWR